MKSLHPDDDYLEARIKSAIRLLSTATNAAVRERAWQEVKTLHGQRTERQIANMERELGLAQRVTV